MLPEFSVPTVANGVRKGRVPVSYDTPGKQHFKEQSVYATASFFGAAVACFASPFPRKLTNSEFTSSAWVQVMQCGPSFTTDRKDRLISLASRSPEAVIGRIRSASPCMTRVGTSTPVRSLRKSSCHVDTQARQAVAEAPDATFQLD